MVGVKLGDVQWAAEHFDTGISSYTASSSVCAYQVLAANDMSLRSDGIDEGGFNAFRGFYMR
jgi:hypothetical protein